MPTLAGPVRLPCGHWARLGQTIKNSKCLGEARVSAMYVASFLNEMTMHPGMEVGPLLGLQERRLGGYVAGAGGNHRVSFWVRVGPGLCDLGLESKASGHWNFYPGPERVALRHQDIPMKMTWGGVGAASRLSPSSVQPILLLCAGGWGAADKQGPHSSPGQALPRDDQTVVRAEDGARMLLPRDYWCGLPLPPALAP